MNRIGYGPAEVAAFRQEVVEQVVPMIQKALALRNKRTGIENPMFWDSTISFADGNPVPHGSYDELMAGARKMYHELSPETAEFIDFMQDNEMFDVLSRPGKMSGGYEEMLPDYKTPFIFANWNGTAGDVDVLTHEAGHALEGYLAARSPKNIPEDIQCPGMESAEIHSMSMEFLTAPWHHLFFKEDTDKYELLHAEDSFIFLPYGAWWMNSSTLCISSQILRRMNAMPSGWNWKRNTAPGTSSATCRSMAAVQAGSASCISLNARSTILITAWQPPLPCSSLWPA